MFLSADSSSSDIILNAAVEVHLKTQPLLVFLAVGEIDIVKDKIRIPNNNGAALAVESRVG